MVGQVKQVVLYFIFFPGFVLLWNGCKPKMRTYHEPYRPQNHFTPQIGWMNDPNGMVYYDGEYHLFYQFTPDQIDVPGPKSWGHAISTDLIHWEELPPALSPDSLGEIWSGSAVVDWENTSGLQNGKEPVIIAIFTHHNDGLQRQSIAYSNDRGRSWTKYAGNPVIPNPGLRDFRDPKVIWHEDTHRWVMVLAAGDRVMFYISPNLIEWEYVSAFGELEGAHGGVWECPDLFPMPVKEGLDRDMWVLLVSVGSGAPNGGSGTQYFVGTFDGTTFTNQNTASTVKWVDYGKDNYAGVTFSGLPDRRIFMGWMSNWYYAYKVPTIPWRGAMTLPRALELVSRDGKGLTLVSVPVPELKLLRKAHFEVSSLLLEEDQKVSVLQDHDGSPFEFRVAVTIRTASQIGIVLKSKDHSFVTMGYDVRMGKLFLDRREAGSVDFEPSFARHIHSAPLILEKDPLILHAFQDASSIEVFANGGVVTLTDLIFPSSEIDSMEIYVRNGEAFLDHLDLWLLAGIWDDR